MTTTERHRQLPDRDDAAPVLGAGETHVGKVRTENQDVIVVEPDLKLYAVLDGMGGGNAGGVASKLASDEIVRRVRNETPPERSDRMLGIRGAVRRPSASTGVVATEDGWPGRCARIDDGLAPRCLGKFCRFCRAFGGVLADQDQCILTIYLIIIDSWAHGSSEHPRPHRIRSHPGMTELPKPRAGRWPRRQFRHGMNLHQVARRR